MIPQIQLPTPTTNYLPAILPSCANLIKKPSLSFSISTIIPFKFNPPLTRKANPSPFRPLRCLSSAVSDPPTKTHMEEELNSIIKPSPAEVSRTVMELCHVGTLSTLTQEGWPLGVGVRFAVDSQGTPILCFNASSSPALSKSTLHVQLEQCGVRTPQCTIQGSIEKPQDRMLLKKLQSIWRTKFEEEVDQDLLYVVAVERILQIDDFMEEGTWVNPADYKEGNPDPLRNFAEMLVDEINTHNMEDVLRFCKVFADLDFQVSEAKVIWVDRLGFDMRITSTEREVYEVRIPFPREVSDKKGAKSSFNCMSQLAWEVEKNYVAPDFNKVKEFKKITRT